MFGHLPARDLLSGCLCPSSCNEYAAKTPVYHELQQRLAFLIMFVFQAERLKLAPLVGHVPASSFLVRASQYPVPFSSSHFPTMDERKASLASFGLTRRVHVCTSTQIHQFHRKADQASRRVYPPKTLSKAWISIAISKRCTLKSPPSHQQIAP